MSEFNDWNVGPAVASGLNLRYVGFQLIVLYMVRGARAVCTRVTTRNKLQE